jgi:hypothetical protein
MDRPGLLIRGLVVLACVATVMLGLSSAAQGILPGPAIAGPGELAVGARLLAIGCLGLLFAGTLWVCIRPDRLFPISQIRFGDGEPRGDRSDRRRKRLLRWSGAMVLAGVAGSMLSGLLM